MLYGLTSTGFSENFHPVNSFSCIRPKSAVVLSLLVFSSAVAVAAEDQCISMVPYLREIRTSAQSSAASSEAEAAYRNMVSDLAQTAESQSRGASGEGYGYGKGSLHDDKARSEVQYHVAASQSSSSSKDASTAWLQNYANTLYESAQQVIGQCLNRRGIQYSFIVSQDGKTFIIRATYASPTSQAPTVKVRSVIAKPEQNVKCDARKFKQIDQGIVEMPCERTGPGAGLVTIATDFYSESGVFHIPDIRPRFREKTVDLNLTWCGGPYCAPDMSRQIAWSPMSTLREMQPKDPVSCTLFDLRKLNVLKTGDILAQDQQFPLQLVKTVKGDWNTLHQNVDRSRPISNHALSICGTRDEPFDNWPNLYFDTRIQIRYFERIR